RIEEVAQVRIEHPVHLLPHDSDAQRIQRLMRAALRPEAIGEAEEVLFVDHVQHLGDSALDELVLQRRHTQRTLPSIAFWNEHSTHRSCSVRPPLQSPRQLLKVFLQVLPVVTPRLCIYPWRGISLQRE